MKPPDITQAKRTFIPVAAMLIALLLLAGCASDPATSRNNDCVGPASFCTPFFGS